MRITAALLLLAACSADRPQAQAPETAPAVALGSGKAKQTSSAIGQSRPAPDTAAAKIMAGGFRPDGSFVHGDHIHKPGQENCPSDMSGGPVQ